MEAKGEHLLETDRWKEDFLKEIERKYEVLAENDRYVLKGVPFYNEARKKQFVETFETAFIMGQ